MEPRDLDSGIDFWRACELTKPQNDPAQDIKFARGSADSDILVGKSDQRLIATVMVGHDGHRGWMYYLGVLPAHRRTGIGRAMVAAAEAWLQARGVWKVNLMVRNSNSTALGFYERLGYDDDEVAILSRRFDDLSDQAGRSD
jgi:hypothetical protein